MNIRERPSPNFNERPAATPIDMLLLHYTGMRTAAEALVRLCDADAKVSAHYTIDEDGAVYRHLAEEKRAWHAGPSFWAGVRDINARSIGIELVNPGHEFGYRAFPAPQIAALIDLGRLILARHPIPPHRVLGHSDVAPRRKSDPGELFPWESLGAAGIGVAVKTADFNPTRPVRIEAVQRDLASFGYECPESGVLDEQTKFVVTAFQRHFRRRRVDGMPDGETAALAAQLVRRIGERAQPGA